MYFSTGGLSCLASGLSCPADGLSCLAAGLSGNGCSIDCLSDVLSNVPTIIPEDKYRIYGISWNNKIFIIIISLQIYIIFIYFGFTSLLTLYRSYHDG